MLQRGFPSSSDKRGDDHVLVESQHHGPGVVVVEDGQRPQLGGDTVRTREVSLM